MRISGSLRWFLVMTMVFHDAAVASDPSRQLELTRGYTIETGGFSGLSGLDWCDGKLLTVDDRGDSDIYQIVFEAGVARLESAVKIGAPPKVSGVPWARRVLAFVRKILGRGVYDWEGISCAEDHIWLVSEIQGGVLELTLNGDPEWFFKGDAKRLQKHGLYQKMFVGAEALTRVNEERMLLAHERNPPALIEVRKHTNEIAVQDLSIEPETGVRRAAARDITGMDVNRGLLYTLHRNAMLVCIRAIDTYKILDCRSYHDTESHSNYRYQDMQYGRGEGIAIKDDHIYIVLDNNKDARNSDGSRQPVVFVFMNPWREVSRTQNIN